MDKCTAPNYVLFSHVSKHVCYWQGLLYVKYKMSECVSDILLLQGQISLFCKDNFKCQGNITLLQRWVSLLEWYHTDAEIAAIVGVISHWCRDGLSEWYHTAAWTFFSWKVLCELIIPSESLWKVIDSWVIDSLSLDVRWSSSGSLCEVIDRWESLCEVIERSEFWCGVIITRLSLCEMIDSCVLDRWSLDVRWSSPRSLCACDRQLGDFVRGDRKLGVVMWGDHHLGVFVSDDLQLGMSVWGHHHLTWCWMAWNNFFK